jgi:hypothetical protein
MKAYRFLFVMVLLFLVSGCTDPDYTTRLLASKHYSDIHITGYGYFNCNENDYIRALFTATDSDGKPVTGIVCVDGSGFSTIKTQEQ